MSEGRKVQRATVDADGVFWPVGSAPPPEVAETFGDHIWEAPEVAASGGYLMPLVQPAVPFGVQMAPVNPFDQPEPQPEPVEELPAEPETAPQSESSATPEAGSDGGVAAPAAPPLSGPGSGVEAWRDYAAAHGVDVPEHAKRAEIVEALEAAGHPVN